MTHVDAQHSDQGHQVPVAPATWGRWGAQDERGAANLVTPSVTVDAVATVREGRVIPLALPIKGSTSSTAAHRVPHLDGRPLPQHFMSVDGGDYAAGSRRMDGDVAVSDDAVVISPHGTTTHIDALAHMWRGETLYNGHPGDRVRSYGATRCGIDKLGGIVTRGVLFDVPGLLGVPYLEPGASVTAEHLAACVERTGIAPRSGDVALIRTGWPIAWSERAEDRAQAGLTIDAARWLVEREVCAIGADNASINRLTDEGRAIEAPDDDVHLFTLWRNGVYLIELLWLEELAASGRADVLFMVAPLAIEGGTASPVTPLAVL